MSCRVNVINKNTGVTYVYESHSYWDKEKQKPRNKRTCIGKLDPSSGDFIPSKRLKSAPDEEKPPVVTASRGPVEEPPKVGVLSDTHFQK